MRSLREITENEKVITRLPQAVPSCLSLAHYGANQFTGLQRRGWKYRPCENSGRLDTGKSRNFVRLMTQLV